MLFPSLIRAVPARIRGSLTVVAAVAATLSLSASVSKSERGPLNPVKLPLGYQLKVEPYEGIVFGATKDENNEGFVDILASLRLPILPGGDVGRGGFRLTPDERWTWHPFLAATYRGGQHLGTRDSSPVVSKRFNPVLLGARFNRDPHNTKLNEFFDVVYAHESNGQSIASRETYNDIYAAYLRSENDPVKAEHIARDNISRGWDYVGVRYDRHTQSLSLSASIKAFLDESFPQGEKEDYNADWENDPEGKSRLSVDGLSLSARYRFESQVETALTFTTGLSHMFQYRTFKLEVGYRFRGNARSGIFLWARQGYNVDLVNYYRRNASVGLSFVFWDADYRP